MEAAHHLPHGLSGRVPLRRQWRLPLRRGLIWALALAAVPALAEPAPGYRLERVEAGLARPSGLARDGDALVATDLATGRVVRIGADGTAVDLTPPLPVGRDVMGEPTGPYKVRVHAGRVYVSQGWPDVDRAEGPLDHAILALGGAPVGAPHVLAAGFWNPYDFEWGGDAWYVVDAGRNALMRMEVDGAGLTAVFAFPRLQHDASALKRLSPTVFKPGELYEVDAVPTGLAIAGGRVFVALFGGFPYVEQGGAVVSLPMAGAAARARLEVTRLDAPIDLAFAADGRLLVLEMGRFDLERGFVAGSGRLTAIDLASGAREILASALDLPVTVVPLPAGGAVIAQMAGGIIRLAKVAQ